MDRYFLDVYGYCPEQHRAGGWAFVLTNRNTGEKIAKAGSERKTTSLTVETISILKGLSAVPDASHVILRTRNSFFEFNLPCKLSKNHLLREQFARMKVNVFLQKRMMEYSECKQMAVNAQRGMDWLIDLQRNAPPLQPPPPPLSKTARRKQKHERRMIRKYGAPNNKKHTT